MKTATKTARARDNAPEPLRRLRKAIERGDDWFDALLDAIADWELSEETVRGRCYQYLIGGEAFDWLLLAERLCIDVNGGIPRAERDALLFHGRAPRSMDDAEFRQAIGDAKHRAHLNFMYGVAVEETLQLVIEEEVLKEQRSLVWHRGEDTDGVVFERIYGRNRDAMLAAYREANELEGSDEMSYSELKTFTYWLFKYRVSQSDPARVASDTRKALVQLSKLEAASRRRTQFLASSGGHGVVVEGELVARIG